MKVILKIKNIILYFCLPYLNLCMEIWQLKINKNKIAPILTTENLRKHLTFAAFYFTVLAK